MLSRYTFFTASRGGVDGGSRIGLSEGIETTYEEDADITDTEEELYPAGVDRNQVRSC